MALVVIAYFVLSRFSPKLFAFAFAIGIGLHAYGLTYDVGAVAICLGLWLFGSQQLLGLITLAYLALIPVALFQVFG